MKSLKIKKDNTLQFNENGVCSSPNKEVISILNRIIKENIETFLGENEFELIDDIRGKATGSQELGRTFKFELKIKNNERSRIIYFKLCPKWPKLDGAKQEYATLKKLYEKYSETTINLGVARPIGHFPELNAYAQESVGENNLKKYLLKTNSRYRKNEELSRLYDIIRECGHWLYNFHDVTKSKKDQKFDYHSFVNGEDNDFRFTLLEDFTFNEKTLTLFKDCICHLKVIDGAKCPAAWWHFDYTPAHIFLDNGLHVIDIRKRKRTHI